jgi:hypothetical protein
MRKHFGADHFVDRVVPPDILAREQQIAKGVEQRGRMQSTGSFEDCLIATQGRWKAMNHR